MLKIYFPLDTFAVSNFHRSDLVTDLYETAGLG